MNVFVQRMVKRFGELDEADAVAFAETILESASRINPPMNGMLSRPAKRELNLALVFLNTKYPFQCCGKRTPESVCDDCPMQTWEEKRCEQERSATA